MLRRVRTHSYTYVCTLHTARANAFERIQSLSFSSMCAHKIGETNILHTTYYITMYGRITASLVRLDCVVFTALYHYM